MEKPLLALLGSSLGVLLASSAAQAQSSGGRAAQTLCEPSAVPTFGALPGPDGAVFDSVVHDDGSGPELHVCGAFTAVTDVPAHAVARFDGVTWSAVGAPPASFVGYTLATFDDSTGRKLYLAGELDHPTNALLVWDGASWSSLGTFTYPGILGALITDLIEHDDGSGPALYAAGRFSSVNGVPAASLARWDGTSWSGLPSPLPDWQFSALVSFDDGSGPKLYASGSSLVAFDRRFARWNGSQWTILSNSEGTDLVVFDGGGGVGPAIHGVSSGSVRYWTGSAWTSLGTIANVECLGVHDDGSGAGPRLYAGLNGNGSQFEHSRTATWTGTSWVEVANGGPGSGRVTTLCTFDDGSGAGPTLWAGGDFSLIDGCNAQGVARWDGLRWSSTGGSGLTIRLSALEVFDDGSGAGPTLYAGAEYSGGGSFTESGVASQNSVGRWDGTRWSPVGTGLVLTDSTTLEDLTVFDDGSGPKLVACGRGSNSIGFVAQWDGVAWSWLGSSEDWGRVQALTVFPDGFGAGPLLYAAGTFRPSAGGGVSATVAQWNGASWAPLGTGPTSGANTLAMHDDGTGPALYAGGTFTIGAPSPGIARWDGAGWSAVGSGVPGNVHALASFDDDSGSGPMLHAAGLIHPSGGGSVPYLSRWDGSSWSALVPVPFDVQVLAVFDDGSGSGPALFAAGRGIFSGPPTNHFAKWDGSTWTTLGEVADSDHIVADLVPFDGPGTESSLVLGGAFTRLWSGGDSYVARWKGCADTLAPTLACPRVVSAILPAGASSRPVEFVVTATDHPGVIPTIVCVPPSGSFFPVGRTTVTCTATDAAGNQATCTFEVKVTRKARRR